MEKQQSCSGLRWIVYEEARPQDHSGPLPEHDLSLMDSTMSSQIGDRHIYGYTEDLHPSGNPFKGFKTTSTMNTVRHCLINKEFFRASLMAL